MIFVHINNKKLFYDGTLKGIDVFTSYLHFSTLFSLYHKVSINKMQIIINIMKRESPPPVDVAFGSTKKRWLVQPNTLCDPNFVLYG